MAETPQQTPEITPQQALEAIERYEILHPEEEFNPVIDAGDAIEEPSQNLRTISRRVAGAGLSIATTSALVFASPVAAQVADAYCEDLGPFPTGPGGEIAPTGELPPSMEGMTPREIQEMSIDMARERMPEGGYDRIIVVMSDPNDAYEPVGHDRWTPEKQAWLQENMMTQSGIRGTMVALDLDPDTEYTEENPNRQIITDFWREVEPMFTRENGAEIVAGIDDRWNSYAKYNLEILLNQFGDQYHRTAHPFVYDVRLEDYDDPNQPQQAEVIRLAGATRQETAIEISRDRFADGEAEFAGFATADNYPDAFAGAPVVGGPEDNDGPLLLLNPHIGLLEGPNLAVVQEALRAVRPDANGMRQAKIFGDNTVVSDEFVRQLNEELGFVTDRYEGASRVETALDIFERLLEQPQIAVLVDGQNAGDAALGSNLASFIEHNNPRPEEEGQPPAGVLLTNGAQANANVVRYLEQNPGICTVAIGEAAAAAHPDSDIVITAANQAELAALVAEHFPVGGDGRRVNVAVSGSPDSFTGGGQTDGLEANLLFTDREVLPNETQRIIQEMAIGRAVLLGGANTITSDVETYVRNMLEQRAR